jgi:hypothetical protein
MKKLLAAALAGGLSLGVAGVAFATGPDATGPAKHGLCTAYFNGSDTGRANKRGAPPFQNLEAAAEAQNQTVEAFCGVTRDQDGNVTSDGLVGGNPDYTDPGAGNNNRGGNK